jgi:putative membrane protein
MTGIRRFIINHEKSVRLFFIIFYTVGFAGIAYSESREMFIKLIPFSLILSFSAIILFHEQPYSRRTLLIFCIIYILSFITEMAGVNTHKIFGNYYYGEGLGIKLFNTPLIIGINWVLLVYASGSLVENIRISIMLKIILSAAVMTGYDLILEQASGLLKMWHWHDDKIPIQNYAAWFIMGLIFQAIMRTGGINMKNSIATVILIIQALFFVSLKVYFD